MPTALFHCAGGTDRTGIIAALLLGIAGVPEGTIAEDYALSAKALLERQLAEEPREGASPDDMTNKRSQQELAPAEAMRMTLRHLEERYGGIEGYVRAIGLTTDHIESIRAAMLE